MAGRTLLRVAWRYLARHPWQSFLMVLGIALGVAVAVAVDLANVSASRAFELSTEAVAGKATHFIAAGPGGLDESVYADLRRSGIGAPLAPVIAEYVAAPQLGQGLFQLLGVDAFAEAPFRAYLGAANQRLALADLVAFLTVPDTVILSAALAQRSGLEVGQELTLEIAGQARTVRLAALIQPDDRLSERALETLILADIATAQELTGRLGRLDRLDVILPPDAPEMERALAARLPTGVQLLPVQSRSGTVQQMSAAFQVNLTALSLLALVVGLFLIYNTMTFSVVQRRPLFGTLRCLGVTRQEVFLLVVGEALLVGLLGSALGLGLGVLLGQGAVRLVTQTINDLFFVVTVQGVQIPLPSLLKGALLGVLATVLTAAPPAWEAASVPPRAALSRSGLESKARRAIQGVALLGLAAFAAGLLILLWPTRSLVVSFGGTFAVVLGFAMLAPFATWLLARLSGPPAGRLFGVLGRMATRDVVNSLSRTAVAVAALMVAVAVTIGVSLMVNSFRYTVVLWLDEVLQGDIYISAPSLLATQTSAPLAEQALTRLNDPQVMAQNQIEQVYVLRSVAVDSPNGLLQVAASSNSGVGGERMYLNPTFSPAEIADRMQQGAVIVSEPLFNRLGLPERGAVIEMYTDQGLRSFPVVGVYYDYGSTTGTVLMSLAVYRQYWQDPVITSAALRLQAGADPDQVTQQLRAELAGVQELQIRPNKTLRAEVMEVFDRTFAITGALQLLATVVAFIGVLSALLSLELERQRELGILRAIGLTARQLWGLIGLETGLLGAVAGLLAMPTGYVLAYILVYIINRRSFGWTLQMNLLPEPFFQAFALALGAALLAGLYPAYRMGKLVAAEAMRYE